MPTLTTLNEINEAGYLKSFLRFFGILYVLAVRIVASRFAQERINVGRIGKAQLSRLTP